MNEFKDRMVSAAGWGGKLKPVCVNGMFFADNLWTDSLALDLDELAQQKTFIDRLTEQMQAPGYQDTFTLPKKDGTMIPTLNPLHEYRDKAVQKFQAGMERLRAEAIKRKLQARQFK